MNTTLTLEQISFSYSCTPIFENFSTQLPDNTLIIGKNGSGKTTLLKLIAKILIPQKGTILLNNDHHYRSAIFFNHRILFDSLTIQQHILWMINTFHLKNTFLSPDGSELMEKSFIDRKPSELSEGERQWAAIMLTCLMPADLYLLDEPLRNLDDSRCDLFSRFIQTQIQNGHHFILSAHNDRIYPNALSPFLLPQSQNI